MPLDILENRLACIALIEVAFASHQKPALDQFAPHGGLDTPYAIKNWGELTRGSVLELPFFGDYLAEDLSYMSSSALRYFLPYVLILFLMHPSRIEFGGFLAVVGRLEGLFGCRDGGEFYRQIHLSPAQRGAIYDWCGQIMTIIRKFDLSRWEDEYVERLRRIRTVAHQAAATQDYEDALHPKQGGGGNSASLRASP